MKAGKNDNKDDQVELNGKVTKKKFAKGSKSEHNAIYFETDSGSYILRRRGGNPFNDPELQKLIGEKICATGIISNFSFIASNLKKIN
jgi:hypothetical protein